ncbi:MAG: peptidoglycan DD-metalloendopeptidase family protein [Chloroflexia bacterium]
MRPPRPILPVLLLLLLAAGTAGAATRRQTESELQSVRARIEAVTRQISRDAVERDRLSRALKGSELALASGREEVARLQAALAASREHRAAVQRDRDAEQRRLEAQRADLASQLRAAYAIGRAEPLRLLLDQRDLAQAGRMFTYYGYFSRARAGQIEAIRARVTHIDELDGQLAADEARLGELQAGRQAALQQLAGQHAERTRVLASLDAGSRTREQSLARLKTQQADLEKLLRELARSIRSVPPDTSTAFGQLRGRLAWPVQGRLAAGYGDERAGGVRWEGVVVATQREAPVRAVAAGRIVYADWLPGLGLLAIVDHGAGYLSLYGYNARLEQPVGTLVDAGEVIAAAGDTGGRPQPELYFEIRRAGKPVDPRPWFRSRRP